MKNGMQWPIGVAMILLATVAGNIGVIVLTGDDPSFAVEPDYYRKAVEWDSTQAQATRSDALAWTVSARVTLLTADASTLTLSLVDADGAAVRAAQLTGSLLHIARASEMQSVVFVETPDGGYAATVPMQRAGMWELRISASRNTERFLHTVRIDTEQQHDTTGGP